MYRHTFGSTGVKIFKILRASRSHTLGVAHAFPLRSTVVWMYDKNGNVVDHTRPADPQFGQRNPARITLAISSLINLARVIPRACKLQKKSANRPYCFERNLVGFL